MAILKRYILPLSIIILSLVLFQVLKVTKVSRLWNGYSVMYVPVDSDKRKVFDSLEQSGIEEYIALENQYVPLPLQDKSPEVCLSIAYGNNDSSYLSSRSAYFFDKDRLFSVIYIPEKYSNKLSAVIFALDKQHSIKAGLNASSAYPFIVPIITLLFALLLIFYSDSRLLAVISYIIPVSFSFFVPLYATSCALCLFMYALFLYFRLHNRRSFVEVLKRNPLFVTMLSFSVFIMLFTGVKSAFLFILMIAASVSAILLYTHLCEDYDSWRYSFVPVKIRSAGMIRVVTKKSRFCLLLLSGAVFLTFVFALFSVHLTFPDSSSSSVALPSSEAFKKSLPDIEDFVDWRWEALVSPYISLNSEGSHHASDLNTVSFPRYREENGLIVQEESSITFNQNFKDESIRSIENLDFPAIEKVLRKQGKMKPGFSSSSKARVTPLSIVLMALAFFCPLFFYFFITNPTYRRGSK